MAGWAIGPQPKPRIWPFSPALRTTKIEFPFSRLQAVAQSTGKANSITFLALFLPSVRFTGPLADRSTRNTSPFIQNDHRQTEIRNLLGAFLAQTLHTKVGLEVARSSTSSRFELLATSRTVAMRPLYARNEMKLDVAVSSIAICLEILDLICSTPRFEHDEFVYTVCS